MESDLERRTFHFFCKRTVGILSGIFNPTFWTRLVLQAAHHEPAIRHAVIALGALHERSEVGSRDESSIFAMQQYGKAIRCLVKPIQEKQKQAADVVLITCVIFVSFETMRGRLGAAISHIEGGVKIISELQPGTEPAETWSISTIPYAESSILNPIFIRLDKQACEISSGRKRLLLNQILVDKASGYHDDIPLIFASLEQARNSLDHIRTFAMRFVESAASQPSFSDPVKRALTLEVLKNLTFVKLQQWSSAFDSFTKNSAGFDVAGQVAIHVLEMHRIVTGVVMEVDEDRSFADGTVWDQYEPQFESIVSHATSITELHLASCVREGRKRSTFYLDEGVANPLFFVAGTCRDGALRRKSIELLRVMDWQEGIMHTSLAAQIAERFMSIEEEDLVGGEGFLRASEVPGENRLAGMEVRWVTDRSVHLSYNRMGRRMIGGDGYEGGKVVVEEWMEW
ncbi:MAG: hypothetical protein M1818_001293 [Claussenomyces sp. TS43310]|nr:MAG: hypothetical protein M1818_001293 [Claussenomyces sp. TS43310]